MALWSLKEPPSTYVAPKIHTAFFLKNVTILILLGIISKQYKANKKWHMPMRSMWYKKRESLQINSLLQTVEINKLPIQLPYLILLLQAVQILGSYSRCYVQSNIEVPIFPIFWNFHRFFYKQFSFPTEQKMWSLSTSSFMAQDRTTRTDLKELSCLCGGPWENIRSGKCS